MKSKKIIFNLLVFSIILTIFNCEITETGTFITKLTVTADKDYEAKISESDITFENKVPNGWTEVTIKTLTISDEAIASKNVGDKLNVGKSNNITVVSENGETQNYTLLIYEQPLPTKPSVSIGEVTSITISGATISGTIVSLGTGKVYAYGHVWGTTQNPTITGTGFQTSNKGETSDIDFSFTTEITGLSENTTYFIRSYSTNIVGTSYSNTKQFSTLD